MIRSFTVENFKSIKEKQTLDLAVYKKDIHVNNVAHTDDPKLATLKTVGIYGANASGKSNLLKALTALLYIIRESSKLTLDQEIIGYFPYRLSKEYKNKPSTISLELIGENDLIYNYELQFTEQQIEREALSYFPKAREVKLFERTTGENGEFLFDAGAALKGKKRKIPCLKNVLYLSKAANEQDGPEIIKNFYIQCLTSITSLQPGVGLGNLGLADDNNRNKVALLLGCADIGITEIRKRALWEQENPMGDIPEELRPSMNEDEKKFFRENIKHKPRFIHHGVDEEFELYDESNGTRRLYHIAPAIIWTLEIGGTFIIDEIGNSMHSYISEFIIKLFNDPQVNKKNAQLIFATHDASLMDQSKMRRDQIWFTEKNSCGATELYCLDEFKEVKKDTSFRKWYMENRFNGVPRIDYAHFREKLLQLMEGNGNG